MTWQDETKPCSFRGLQFEGVELGKSGGNVLVVDKIPESDDHTVGELGNDVDGFRLAGFVHGDDYLDQLGNLEAAFKKRGAGELVTAWRGQLLGFVQRWSLNYPLGGGVGEFEIEFVPAGVETRPSVLVITETDIIEKGDVAKVAAYTAADDAAALVAALPAYIRAISNAAIYGEYLVLAEMAGVTVPEFAATQSTIEAYIDAIDDLARLVVYLNRPPTTPEPVSTPSGEVLNAATAAVAAYLHTAVLSRVCELAQALEYVSADAAEQQAAVIAAFIDAELDLEPADEVFDGLADLRASFVGALLDIASGLPRQRSIRVGAPTPALVLAFDLYGDVEREAEILQLNAAGHPGFLVGDMTVLSS